MGDNGEKLLDVVAKELAYEKEEGSPATELKELKAALGSTFKLVDEAGLARFHLERKVRGLLVRVDVDCSPMPSEEDDVSEDAPPAEEEDVTEGYRMLVSITDAGKGKQMQVGGFIVDFLRIHRVTMYDVGKAPTADQVFGGADEMPVYAGPAFDELDDNLQQAFYDYLAGLGVDDELARKLADYSSAKEQTEYVNWLSNVQRFLK